MRPAVARRIFAKRTDYFWVLVLLSLPTLPFLCARVTRFDPRITLEHLHGHTAQEVVSELGLPDDRMAQPLVFFYKGAFMQRYGVEFDGDARVVRVTSVRK